MPTSGAILDAAGAIKYWRRITPSKRMRSVHRRLEEMFENTTGEEISLGEFRRALLEHQSLLDPKRIEYSLR
ncbi:MAG: hypothetical protein D6772_13180 [Bacteroidetes bacterium]|nr:MAG: hypothetical protein D6772_13180 [Bacteroidota bacterium]